MGAPLTPREELLAIAAWRLVLADRATGHERRPEEYAAMFPEASEAILAELTGGLAGERPGAVIGHYRLVEVLGRGGQGTVWLAADLQLGDRPVALKLIPLSGKQAPGAVLRLQREIALALRADVPGVCPVYDTGSDGGFAWIAMRRCDGRTLAQRLADGGGSDAAGGPRVPSRAQLSERLVWLENAARIVHLVHERGVLHRDLKPSNLMIADDGSCVVLDFGVARALDDTAEGLTATGATPGTPAFMAPEQVLGGEVGPSADVWAFGVMLFECATGQRPFAGATAFDLQQQIVHGEPPSPARLNRAVPRDLVVVIETALQKRPHHRYQSALLLAEDLRRVRELRPVLARRAGALVRFWRFAQRNPLLVGLLALLFLAIVAGLAASLVLLQRATQEVERADRAQRFVERLTDSSSLAVLKRELEDELAIDSGMVDRFASWHAQGDQLLARRDAHAGFLAELRQQALPPGVDTPEVVERRRKAEQGLRYAQSRAADYERQLAAAKAAADSNKVTELQATLRDARKIEERAAQLLAEAAGFRFADPGVQAMHDEVQGLVRDLDAFVERRPGLTTQLAGRLLWRLAKRVRPESVDQHAAAWAAAAERVAAATGRYSGLRLVPQEGLVPLGPDPRSGLEEFAQLFTGSVPARGDGGELQYTPDTAIVLVLLPGGEVRLGPEREPPAEMRPRFHAIPPPAVVRLEPFFLGKHEVTQAQWFAIQWHDPSLDLAADGTRKRHPVEHVTVREAFTFARRLGLGLPSEAQWEYGCRAGSRTAFEFGDDPAAIVAFGNLLEQVAIRELPPDGFHRGAPVGSYRPNSFGLFDLHGNVREWTSDVVGWYDTLPAGPDGRRLAGPLQAHVVRGGSFLDAPVQAQSWWREVEPPEHRFGDLGFRVARPVRGR